MNSTDVIVLIFLGFFALRGFLRGIVREFFALAQIFTLILFITTYVPSFQGFLSRTITPANYWAALTAGILLICIVFGVIMGMLHRLVHTWNLSVVNRILGLFMGILFGIFFCFLGLRILLFFADAMDWTSLKANVGNWINQSRLLQTLLAFLNSLLNSDFFRG